MPAEAGFASVYPATALCNVEEIKFSATKTKAT
jgi:hypothetical protein